MLGPKQKAWVEALRANPEQKIEDFLGSVKIERYCCLGKLCQMNIESLERNGIMHIDDKGYIRKTTNNDETLPDELVSEYGFLSAVGALSIPIGFGDPYTHKRFNCGTEWISNKYTLAELNDSGATWLEIADYIEQNPGNVFTKFV